MLCRYSIRTSESGIKPTLATARFEAFNANEIEPGLIRLGGFSASPLQISKPAVLAELIFLPLKTETGSLKLLNPTDDIRSFRLLDY